MDENMGLGKEGGGAKVVVAGTEYTLLPPGEADLAEFQAYLEGRELQAACGAKGKVPDAVYDKLLATHLEHVATGHYSFGRQAFRDGINTDAGCCRWVWLLMRERQPQITEADVRKLMRANQDGFLVALRALVGDDGSKKAKEPAMGTSTP